MHITEFLKTNKKLKIEVELQEPSKVLLTTSSGELMIQEYIDNSKGIPGTIEATLLKQLDRIVAKQNEVAAAGNS